MKEVQLLLLLVASFMLFNFTIAAEQRTEGKWEIDYTVDEFGDIVEDSDAYIKAGFTGEFSNTATKDSDLTVVVFYQPFDFTGSTISFRLLEYGNTPASYFEDSNKQFKIKVNDTIYEDHLGGFSPNGDVYLFYGRASTKEESRDNSVYFQLIRSLYEGKDVRCIAIIDNSKYSFSLEASNFHEVFDTLQEDICKRADALFESEKYDEALDVYSHLFDNEILQKRADELFDLGRYEEAADYYIALDDATKEKECLHKQADVLFESGKYDEAIIYYIDLGDAEKEKECRYLSKDFYENTDLVRLESIVTSEEPKYILSPSEVSNVNEQTGKDQYIYCYPEYADNIYTQYAEYLAYKDIVPKENEEDTDHYRQYFVDKDGNNVLSMLISKVKTDTDKGKYYVLYISIDNPESTNSKSDSESTAVGKSKSYYDNTDLIRFEDIVTEAADMLVTDFSKIPTIEEDETDQFAYCYENYDEAYEGYSEYNDYLTDIGLELADTIKSEGYIWKGYYGNDGNLLISVLISKAKNSVDGSLPIYYFVYIDINNN